MQTRVLFSTTTEQKADPTYENLRRHFKQAMVHCEKGEYEKAEALLNKHSQLMQQYPEYYFYRGVLHFLYHRLYKTIDETKGECQTHLFKADASFEVFIRMHADSVQSELEVKRSKQDIGVAFQAKLFEDREKKLDAYSFQEKFALIRPGDRHHLMAKKLREGVRLDNVEEIKKNIQALEEALAIVPNFPMLLLQHCACLITLTHLDALYLKTKEEQAKKIDQFLQAALNFGDPFEKIAAYSLLIQYYLKSNSDQSLKYFQLMIIRFLNFQNQGKFLSSNSFVEEVFKAKEQLQRELLVGREKLAEQEEVKESKTYAIGTSHIRLARTLQNQIASESAENVGALKKLVLLNYCYSLFSSSLEGRSSALSAADSLVAENDLYNIILYFFNEYEISLKEKQEENIVMHAQMLHILFKELFRRLTVCQSQQENRNKQLGLYEAKVVLNHNELISHLQENLEARKVSGALDLLKNFICVLQKREQRLHPDFLKLPLSQVVVDFCHLQERLLAEMVIIEGDKACESKDKALAEFYYNLAKRIAFSEKRISENNKSIKRCLFAMSQKFQPVVESKAEPLIDKEKEEKSSQAKLDREAKKQAEAQRKKEEKRKRNQANKAAREQEAKEKAEAEAKQAQEEQERQAKKLAEQQRLQEEAARLEKEKQEQEVRKQQERKEKEEQERLFKENQEREAKIELAKKQQAQMEQEQLLRKQESARVEDESKPTGTHQSFLTKEAQRDFELAKAIHESKQGKAFRSAQILKFVHFQRQTIWMSKIEMALEKEKDVLVPQAFIYGGHVRDGVSGRHQELSVCFPGSTKRFSKRDTDFILPMVKEPYKFLLVLFSDVATVHQFTEGSAKYVVIFNDSTKEKWDFNFNSELNDASKPRLQVLREMIDLLNFPCNSLLYTSSGDIFDLTGVGVQDAVEKRLRFISSGKKFLSEGAIGIFHVYKLLLRDGYQPDEELVKDMSNFLGELSEDVKNPNKQNSINKWIGKLFCEGYGEYAFRVLFNKNILQILFPVLDDVLRKNKQAMDFIQYVLELADDEKLKSFNIFNLYAIFSIVIEVYAKKTREEVLEQMPLYLKTHKEKTPLSERCYQEMRLVFDRYCVLQAAEAKKMVQASYVGSKSRQQFFADRSRAQQAVGAGAAGLQKSSKLSAKAQVFEPELKGCAVATTKAGRP